MSELWERELDEPEPKVVCHCKCCDGEIYAGEEVYKTNDGSWYCQDCCRLFEVESPEPNTYEEYLIEEYERNRHDE